MIFKGSFQHNSFYDSIYEYIKMYTKKSHEATTGKDPAREETNLIQESLSLHLTALLKSQAQILSMVILEFSFLHLL